MIAISVLMRLQGLCPGARAAHVPCYAIVLKAISTKLRIHSFMYLLFCAHY